MSVAICHLEKALLHHLFNSQINSLKQLNARPVQEETPATVCRHTEQMYEQMTMRTKMDVCVELLDC